MDCMLGYVSGEMGDEMPFPQQAVCTSARMSFTSVRVTTASCFDTPVSRLRSPSLSYT